MTIAHWEFSEAKARDWLAGPDAWCDEWPERKQRPAPKLIVTPNSVVAKTPPKARMSMTSVVAMGLFGFAGVVATAAGGPIGALVVGAIAGVVAVGLAIHDSGI